MTGDGSKSQAQNTTNIAKDNLKDPNTSTPPVPSISLPKGGGAIQGLGEKFNADLISGSGSVTILIATNPGRVGFGLHLSLSCSSGGGNGPFSMGWHLSLPSITRKTDKGLPKYQDADESDVDWHVICRLFVGIALLISEPRVGDLQTLGSSVKIEGIDYQWIL
jgi:hypothetical protein